MGAVDLADGKEAEMRRVTWLALLAGLIAACGVGVWARQSHYPGVSTPAARDIWEYQVLAEPTPGSGAVLNRVGGQGWELVTALVQDEHIGNATRTQTYYILKRRATQ